MLFLNYLDENDKDSIKDQRTQEDCWKEVWDQSDLHDKLRSAKAI